VRWACFLTDQNFFYFFSQILDFFIFTRKETLLLTLAVSLGTFFDFFGYFFRCTFSHAISLGKFFD